MTRVPFGTTASPFLLSATLPRHLRKCEQYPQTASRLKSSVYVGDSLTGAESKEAALRLYNEATEIFEGAKLKMHKWSSNSEMLCQQFKRDSRGAIHFCYLLVVL